ncbi:FAD-dependent oxidoreductase [Haladaptatus sp. DJG-WS-42]|uniref:NAD(P)/FAD-dependent oxidoreductase n=1 Tax=Haladaptatus sp. DJG-WS-42 TaxID=3120516 RepID=UPI0030CFD967
MPPSSSCDVLVIGGGAVGTSTARAAAERGGEVILLEAESIGGGSTAKAAGMFRSQFSTLETAHLAARSVLVFEAVERETGIGLHQPGYLLLGGDAYREKLEQAADNAAQFGTPVRRYEGDECRDRLPTLCDDAVSFGTEVSTDGYADPYLFATAQAQAARAAGATIHTNTPVTEISVSDGSVETVTAGDRRIQPQTVVNATGVWAPQIGSLAGVSMPISPIRTFALTSPVSLDDSPMVLSLDHNVYYRDEPGGGTLIGGPLAGQPADPDSYDGSVSLDTLLELGERIERVDSRFADMEIERSWAGLKAATPDGLPIIGSHATVENLITAAGFNGHGFMLSPGVGDAVSALALGDDPFVDLSIFSPSRFADRDAQNQHTRIRLS